ncbi:MAG: type II toxin-antitoxin system VapC family toxin [Burkholderiaceae bacterium]|jgi:predicted nucleic acid-binding protein|nr:type II toxin-antitoxin system VapC family toxin [Burkholderiaceae bacterium]MCU0965456.1 type II toxin-antitoxin system VapC family toxin [Burkholderiaceae bacterium]
MSFVIDNSVVSGWYLEDQATPYTEHVAARLAEDRACAPALWELELANVLRSSCLRRRMTAEKAQQILARIAQLPIDTDRHAVPPHELLALALRFGLSSYDAAYLELALRRQLPLATQDEALRAAALAAGVGCVDASS